MVNIAPVLAKNYSQYTFYLTEFTTGPAWSESLIGGINLEPTASTALYISVTLGAAIIGALIQAFGRDLWDLLPRSGPTFPILRGHWDAVWYVDKGTKESIYIKDTILLSQRGRSVTGTGNDSKGRGKYTLRGRFNSHGVVTLAYEYERAAMAGSMTLSVNPTSRMCSGRWHGYTEEETVVSGRVEWTKRP